MLQRPETESKVKPLLRTFASESPATILGLISFPYSSQDYVFRYGFVVGACLLAVEAVMVYGADKSFSRSKITLLLSVVAAFALGVIGVVSVKEWLLVHDGERRRRRGRRVFRQIQAIFSYEPVGLKHDLRL